MKAPPFSLFPLRPLDATHELDHARKSLVYPETHRWLGTAMAQAVANKGSLAFILDETPCSGSETESDDQHATAPLPVLPKRRRVSTLKARGPSSPDPKKGSKYCIVEGCTSRAKHARKCWRHGGSVKCRVPECINRAKSKGVCWSHGGGTICSHLDCETIAVSHGFCWAHGGGKRCLVDGCSRPAYERTDNYCATHHKQLLRAGTKIQ